LVWNFTHDLSGGEVAYALNYNIRDQNGGVSGVIDENTAKTLYPQGHGDAWGHYLSAIKNYYRLLVHTNYTWVPRPEDVTVGGAPVTVDYYDERKFAKAASAKARTGVEIVNLAYRETYVEDPNNQYQGYWDTDTNRAWGVAEWASRTGQGAFFDWVVGNSLIPAVDSDPTHTGISKIDRTTVMDLKDIVSAFDDVEAQLENLETGLNPLGVGHNVIPFDIDPRNLTQNQGQTHFEQIYGRATQAMNNSLAVFNNAVNSTQLLRRQADSLADFQKNVVNQEVDFTNRLIESYGYPYPDDCGPGKTYPDGAQDSAPDLFHYYYIDTDGIADVSSPTSATNITQQFISFDTNPTNGAVVTNFQTVTMNLDLQGLRILKPTDWTSARKAPGEIQRTLSDFLQARTRFLKGLKDYDNLLNQIEDQTAVLLEQYNVDAQEIQLLHDGATIVTNLNDKIATTRKTEFGLRTAAQATTLIADSVAAFFPTVNGLDNDFTAPVRGALKFASSIVSQALNITADGLSLDELDAQQTKEEAQAANNIDLTTARQAPGLTNQLMQIRQLVRQEPAQRLDLFNLRQAVIQAAGAYQAAVAKGLRLQDDRARFRAETATQIQEYRYKDMAFRIFRNDALQKYRAQFDLAARYVYLAAKAYDYETCLQANDPRGPGQDFLTDIVRSQTLGLILNGQAVASDGTTLADHLARMWQNWSLVLSSQLGFNNPETESDRFSLRTELFRTQNSTNSSGTWITTLSNCIVADITQMAEFKRYCIPFTGTNTGPEPGIVIPFSTDVNFGQNFFGWPLGGGDSSYDSSHFATKIRGVGVWFANYNSLNLSLTPRVYLIPVGEDVLRSPSATYGLTREFDVVDQLLPVPYVNPNALQDPNWIPINDTLDGNLADIRKFASFRAYHDGGFTTDQMTYSSRLIGRSVWNTKWLLIIPAGTLYYDRGVALSTFINGVSDIKLYFQTYSYSGN
jgi:hypothetical protein